jgi:hypothetical protein
VSRPRVSTREARSLVVLIRRAGGTVTRTSRGHLLVYGPLGTVTVGSKLHADRTWRNAVSQVRRVGLPI